MGNCDVDRRHFSIHQTIAPTPSGWAGTGRKSRSLGDQEVGHKTWLLFPTWVVFSHVKHLFGWATV